MNNFFDNIPTQQFIIPETLDVDPDSFAPNRTAKSAEKTVELLEAMKADMANDSAAQRKRFRIATVLSIIAILVGAVAAVASLYALYLP